MLSRAPYVRMPPAGSGRPVTAHYAYACGYQVWKPLPGRAGGEVVVLHAEQAASAGAHAGAEVYLLVEFTAGSLRRGTYRWDGELGDWRALHEFCDAPADYPLDGTRFDGT